MNEKFMHKTWRAFQKTGGRAVDEKFVHEIRRAGRKFGGRAVNEKLKHKIGWVSCWREDPSENERGVTSIVARVSELIKNGLNCVLRVFYADYWLERENITRINADYWLERGGSEMFYIARLGTTGTLAAGTSNRGFN